MRSDLQRPGMASDQVFPGPQKHDFIPLPLYDPEQNPVEHIWDYLRRLGQQNLALH